jgi:transglutaminase-like putative cysteine protease
VSARTASLERLPVDANPVRALALGAAALVTLSYLTVLYRVTDVVGVSGRFALVVAGALLAGLLCGRYLRTELALAFGVGLLALGALWYARSIPVGFRLLASVGGFSADVVALLTGLSVFRVVNAGVWAIAFVPAPTFLLWYFAIRRRYVLAALCGGSALALFVLTGDAGAPLTLLGVVGAAGLVGFGDLDRRAGDLRGAESVAVVLAAMIVTSLLLSVVPGGAADPLLAGGSSGETIETNLLNTDDRLTVLGGVSLSPEVRFRVESDAPAYWRVGAYDRYTGSDWYRTGGVRPYQGSLPAPPGDSRPVSQTYEPATDLGVMPAAWRPTGVGDAMADRTQVTPTGALRPASELGAGTSYTVTSRVPDTTAADLQDAGRAYPEDVAERYTQLPAGTPDRVGEFTTQLTANANTPYETARTTERWLENNKTYSLDIERPGGSIADSFLFEMNAGYCVYYATTMATMLRTQGIPARFVVGYTPGEQVGENEWVVRGLDSHAWVEVYFPEEGWVRFDPTPSTPRENAEEQRLENARAAGQSNVDTDGTSGTATPTSPSATSGTNASPEPFDAEDNAEDVAGGDPGGDVGGPSEPTATNGTNATSGVGPSGVRGIAESGGAAGTNGSNASSSGDSGPELPDPTRERLLLGLIVLGGVLAGASRSGAAERAYRAVWLRRQRSHEPVADAERAFSRLEYVLARQHRERRPGETPRTYLAAVDAEERARRVSEIYERARYAGAVSETEAAEAIALVDELVAERSRLGRSGDRRS